MDHTRLHLFIQRWRIKMDLLAYLSICLLVGPVMGGGRAADCRFSFWLNYRGHCYGYFSEELSWKEAKRSCENHRWVLVSIKNNRMYDTLAAFLMKSVVYKDVWIMSTYGEETSKKKSEDFCPALIKTLGFKQVKYVPCVAMLPYLCKVDHH